MHSEIEIELALASVEWNPMLMRRDKSYYEGHSMEQVTFPIRVFKQLGVDTVVCKYYLRFENGISTSTLYSVRKLM